MPAPEATRPEVLRFIDLHRPARRGIGYVDAHLLASATLAGVRLWTRDNRSAAIAGDLRLAFVA